MSTFQFVIALITGIPALLTSIAAFYHSITTKQAITARLAKLEVPHQCNH